MTMMDMDMNPNYFNRYSYTANDPINSTDPTGMYTCADKACDTATIDRYPNPTATVTEGQFGPEITVDLGPEITFKNDVPGGPSTDLPVNTELAKLVEGAVVASGVDSININSSTGGHSSGRHPTGHAVDINKINGQTVHQAKPNPVNPQATTDLQSAFANQGGPIRANFGPSRNTVTSRSGKTHNASSKTAKAHENHIHISIWR